MKQILCSDWLLEWARLRVACFDPAQERNCVEQKNNVHDSWALLAIEMQKVAEDSQNKEDKHKSGGFIVSQAQLTFFPSS